MHFYMNGLPPVYRYFEDCQQQADPRSGGFPASFDDECGWLESEQLWEAMMDKIKAYAAADYVTGEERKRYIRETGTDPFMASKYAEDIIREHFKRHAQLLQEGQQDNGLEQNDTPQP